MAGRRWLLPLGVLLHVARSAYIGHVEILFFAPDDIDCKGDAHLGEYQLNQPDECIEATQGDPASGEDALRLKVSSCREDGLVLSMPCSQGCGSCMVETEGLVDGCVLVDAGDIKFRYMVHSLMCPSLGAEESDALAASEGEAGFFAEDPGAAAASLSGYESVMHGYYEVPEDLVASVLLVDAANPPTESLDGCARICSLAESCMGFTFDMDTYRCWPFTEGVLDHPLKEKSEDENIFTYKKAEVRPQAAIQVESPVQQPALQQVDCNSELADECFRRCIQCMDCEGEACVDVDGNPCTSCEECSPFVPCFFMAEAEATATTTPTPQWSTTEAFSSFNPCADPAAYDPRLPYDPTEASCRDPTQIVDEATCFGLGGEWSAEKGDCDVGENRTACALLGGLMVPMSCGEIAVMFGESVAPETCDTDLGAGMTGRQMLYRAGASCCTDGHPTAEPCGPVLNPCRDFAHFTADVPLQYWCSGASATLTEQACVGEGRYWDAEARMCSIETEAACIEHGLQWVARTCKDVMSYLEYNACAVDEQQCSSEPQLFGGSTLAEVLTYYGSYCCGGGEVTTLCSEPGSMPCTERGFLEGAAQVPALSEDVPQQVMEEQGAGSVLVATPEWRGPPEVDCATPEAEDCFERCGPCWVCEGGDCADADGQACADNCLLIADGACGAYSSCMTPSVQEILCPVGYANVAGICQPCEAGQYQPEFGASECYSCPQGQFSPQAGSNECYACPSGHFAATEGASECVPCQPGTYQPDVGHAGCAPCAPGTFTPEEGSAQCYACPAGFSSRLGATSCTAEQPQGMDPCECMDRWEWGGQTYSGCAETPDMPGLGWCYARGAAMCSQALGSEVNFGLFWVECQVPVQEMAQEVRMLQECVDAPGFVDEQGFACPAWEGIDCTKAVEDYGYSRMGERALLQNCVNSCGFCSEAPECTANEDCYSADCNAPGWVNLGCNYGQCYTGTSESDLCQGQPNGLDLGNGMWCWDGRIDTRCDAKVRLAAGTVVVNYYAPSDAQCASLWSFMVYNFTKVDECVPNPRVPDDWNWPTNDRYTQLVSCEEGVVELRTLCNSDCSQCEEAGVQYDVAGLGCVPGSSQDSLTTSVFYARCPARKSTRCVNLAPDVAERVKAISCSRWNDPNERWNQRLAGVAS